MKHRLLLLLPVLAILFVGCEKLFELGEEDDISDVVNINPDYVPIDWESSTMQSYNDSTGDYVIQFNGTIPNLHSGSIIAIDRDTAAFYRIVVTAERNGNTLHLTTAEADLTDIFHDCNFTLTTESTSNSKAKGVVFRPVAAYTIDDNGTYRAINLNRKSDTRFTHNLWHYGFNNDGYVIHEGTYHRIQMDRMNMDVDIDFEMYMNFGGATARQIAGEAFVRYISDAMQVDAALIGTFNTEQMIRFMVWGDCDVTTPTITLVPNVFPAKTIKFMAGPVPIVLEVQSDLCGKASVSGSGEIQAYAGFSDHAVGRMGFEWDQTSGIRGVANFENEFSYPPPTVEGKGELHRKGWIFPRISIMLYGIVGPGFDFMPYLDDIVRGGFREQMLGQTNDYCAWQYDLSTGLDLCCELNLNIFKRQIFNDLAGGIAPSTPIWNVFNKQLFHSPLKVRHASGRPQNGAQATVNFDVFDTILLTHTSAKTVLPQIVKFEANGQLSSEYGIAVPGTGRVSVQWTPTGNDTLWAKLYDQDGNVISFDTVIVGCDCNITSGDWVDLGLPSGLLWATRNVGASSPTDYGNYYAWGETLPKSVYDWSTYRYCVYNENNHEHGYNSLTKYCDYSYHGHNDFTDNLTTLQPGDDAATANYGGRMPTWEECMELINNTTSTRTTINNVKGRCFTGTNGNSLFLPAAGYRYGSGLYDTDSNGCYWSSSLNPDFDSMPPSFAIFFRIFPYVYCDYDYLWYGSRCYGFSVRAVRQN